MKKILKKIIGSRFRRELKKMQPILDEIHEHERRLASLSDDDVKAQTEKLRGILKERYGAIEEELVAKKADKHGCADPAERDELDREVHKLEDHLKDEIEAALNDTLPEAFATVREACRRLLGTKVPVTGHDLEWDMVPYDVQLTFLVHVSCLLRTVPTAGIRFAHVVGYPARTPERGAKPRPPGRHRARNLMTNPTV